MREPTKIHGKSSAELLRLNGKIKPDRITPSRHVSPRWHWQVWLNSSHPWAEMTGFTNKNWLNKRFKRFNILKWKDLMDCTLKTFSAVWPQQNIEHNSVYSYFTVLHMYSHNNRTVCVIISALFHLFRFLFSIFHLRLHLLVYDGY